MGKGLSLRREYNISGRWHFYYSGAEYDYFFRDLESVYNTISDEHFFVVAIMCKYSTIKERGIYLALDWPDH